ncbi:dimethyl sulfoxide reductase anchor subunit family protein [Aminobacter niigataensis]|uniref:dimethyl sulfoxide reductase anchor subunit family protein n=1 Tax=Aminobacter niigataensis TaxID=83265 RepID=UPI0024C92C8B|nr:DmsC/YnfH family molybdoenzyme membrane anchor subunit [Aminobacter niigataensis]CAI2934236.1 Anaerobic dimethyl sulfoxide reductase chain C [Aminobacter niigataensis]
MHPAPSIILFTTLSGLGYGLAAVLGLGLLDASTLSVKIAHLAALAMIAGGLLSSTLHLGNPQRAWRALSQWQSSWLSREGVMAILTFVPLTISAWFSVVEGRYLPVAGLIGTAMCGITVYCTAMIYASLRSIQAWNTGLTPLCYLLFAAAGGFLLAAVAGYSSGTGGTVCAAIAALSVVAAWIAKHQWWTRLQTLVPLSTPESATGLGNIGHVRLFERPHINDNYLTREMGFKVARKHALKLSKMAMIAGGVVPVLLLVVAMLSGAGAGASVASVLAVGFYAFGLVVERWLFFAEARHAVMNYYGG